MESAINFDDDFFSCSSSSSFASVNDDSFEFQTLHDKLTSVFTSFPNNLNIAHVNVQSISAYYPDLLASISSIHLDALLLTETFLKPSLPSTQFALPGFVLIRNDRIGNGCGGVAIYLRADISFKIVSLSPPVYSESAEFMFLEILVHHSKILLAVFYSRDRTIDYFDSFEALLNDLRPLYDHIIILRDFNTCLIKDDSRSHKLLTLLASLNLSVLPLSATHHFPNCAPSLLDLIIVSSSSKLLLMGS